MKYDQIKGQFYFLKMSKMTNLYYTQIEQLFYKI